MVRGSGPHLNKPFRRSALLPIYHIYFLFYASPNRGAFNRFRSNVYTTLRIRYDRRRRCFYCSRDGPAWMREMLSRGVFSSPQSCSLPLASFFFPVSRSRRFRDSATLSGFIFMETVRFLGREIAFVLYRCRGVQRQRCGQVLYSRLALSSFSRHTVSLSL